MTNAIVYAIYSDREDVDNLMQWRELLYSVETLRSYNSDIDVKVYLSPPERINSISMYPIMDNLEIVPIHNAPTHELPNKTVAKWLDMKYNAAFDCLGSYGYDNVLMIDADTIYQGDPEYLFAKYSENRIYACPDGYDELFAVMGTPSKFMNDGVVIIPQSMLEIKDDLIVARNSYVRKLMDRLDNKIKNKKSDIWVMGVLWAAFQYGIYEHLLGTKNSVRYFDINDVATYADWWGLKDKTRPIILHYWSIGYKNFLPEKYLDGIENIMHRSISALDT